MTDKYLQKLLNVAREFQYREKTARFGHYSS